MNNYQNTGQYRMYYCRVENNQQIIDGFLIENDAGGNKLGFDEYEVLRGILDAMHVPPKETHAKH